MGDRVFLAPGEADLQPTGRPPADAAHWMIVLLEFTNLDWFEAVVDADPLLGPLQVQVDVLWEADPPATQFSDEEVQRYYADRERVPDELRFDGYDVRTVVGQRPARELVIRPVGPTPDFLLYCNDPPLFAWLTGPQDKFGFCRLKASYTPDPSITLVLEMFEPSPLRELVPDLPAVVARLREVVLCLDVTEVPPADPEGALAALLAENPTLSRCSLDREQA